MSLPILTIPLVPAERVGREGIVWEKEGTEEGGPREDSERKEGKINLTSHIWAHTRDTLTEMGTVG